MSLQNLRSELKFQKVSPNTLQNDRKVSMREQTWIFEDVFLQKTKQGQGLGFTVAGGRDAPGGVHIDPQKSVFIQRIVPGGLALADGRLRPRDIIVSVNGVKVQGSTHIHVVELLKNSGSQIHLRVKRSPLMCGKLVEVFLRKSPNHKGLGFSISGGVGTPELPEDDGILVTHIFPDGLAGLDGRMRVGDKILFVDDVDMTGRTHNEAVNILRSSTLSKDVTLQLLRKEDLQRPVSNIHVSRNIDNINNNNVIGPNDGTIYSKVIRRTNPSTNHEPGPPCSTVHRPRRIIIRREGSTQGLGVNIVGGIKGHGLFVNYVLPDSPAERTDLKRGDKLLRVNHVDLRDVSHEEAITALKNSGEHVVIIAQYKPEELEMFDGWSSQVLDKKDDDDDGGGNNNDEGREEEVSKLLTSPNDIFLRSLFDYDPFLDVTFSPFDPAPIERLRVKFGDVFRISRQVLNDQWWQASKVFSSGTNSKQSTQQHEEGFIPGINNRALALKNDANIKEQNRSRNSAEFRTSRRRSFIFSSKLKQKSASKKWASTSGLYEPVLLRPSLHVRPLLILGPLKDRMSELLVSRHPHRFEGSVPHTTRPMRPGEVSGREYVFVLTRDEMERDIRRGAFVEVGVYKDHYYGVSFESIRSIARQRKHCLLDVSIETVPLLRSADIFPVVLLLKSTSKTLISSWLQTGDESRLKSATEQTELLFLRHKNIFSAVVEGRTEEDLYHGVLKAVEKYDRRCMWVPSDEKLF